MGNTDIGTNPLGSGPRAAQSNLFLYGKSEIDLVWRLLLQPAHCFYRNDTTYTIVKGFGNDAAATDLHFAHESGRLANRYRVAVSIILHVNIEISQRLATTILHGNDADRAIFKYHAIAVQRIVAQTAHGR